MGGDPQESQGAEMRRPFGFLQVKHPLFSVERRSNSSEMGQ